MAVIHHHGVVRPLYIKFRIHHVESLAVVCLRFEVVDATSGGIERPVSYPV